MTADSPAFTIGVSLKTYLSHARTLRWATELAEVARRHPAVRDGVVELFVAPTFPALVPVRDVLAGAGVRLAAQDVSATGPGASTGEVTAAELAEIGCSIAEVGHAERRALFHEDDAVVAAKTAAALRDGLTPLICVGEDDRAPAAVAAREVQRQVDAALAAVEDSGRVVVAYEPVWAIGAESPASSTHIAAVVAALEAHLAALPGHADSRVVYGGSAGPGLLTELGGRVRGLFLGRRAHDVSAVEGVLDEALALAAVSPVATATAAAEVAS